MTHPSPSRSARLRSLVTSRASGAVIAQVWQAAGSFALQVLAAHLLGARGLGVVALCLGVIVLTTAITSGFVGDSLTVLDRADVRVRAALQAWTLLLAFVGPSIAGAVLWATDTLSAGEALVFFAAGALFQVEEVARRVLMAGLQFWRLVLVDGVALFVALATVAVTATRGPLGLGAFLAAVAVGQLAGLVVALRLVAPQERWLAPWSGADLRAVASFGAWRGAQVAVNPGVFTAMRVFVVAAAGGAALGQVEAARIYVAPAILAIQGFGSFLLASYSRDRARPLAALVPSAVRASVAMVAAVLLVGVALWALVPVVGPWITGGSFDLPAVTVLGWSVYAASTATFTPLLCLAVSRGQQRVPLLIRGVDASVSLGVLGLLLWGGMPYTATPFALAAGPVVGGLAIRALVIGSMLRAEQSTPALAVPATAQPREAAHHAR
ncbi:Membrane protein involved in the export of O-antigen and teichoic acid [Pedococcus dokdonensis]|uniref:Membrane protein involved in the export of O-antigen and teichoic acid n=1 Tax=Pedococcus dokdonensis TaxID=443156 RepID=A0A1H0S8M0_9MICO|nr:Membrane protein involved in the export of O-antigen and teichoic acid [Pedococcus dokdonensis]